MILSRTCCDLRLLNLMLTQSWHERRACTRVPTLQSSFKSSVYRTLSLKGRFGVMLWSHGEMAVHRDGGWPAFQLQCLFRQVQFGVGQTRPCSYRPLLSRAKGGNTVQCGSRFITTSPMRASKWVVNRYFDNATLLEKGAGNARDASQVMLVHMEPNTPSTIV